MDKLKDQHMKKLSVTLAIAGLFTFVAADCGANTITENFSADPLQNGWQIFGDTNLFQWDSANQNLNVIWDSSQPNSYFFHSLGVTLTKDYDFSIQFDLELADITSGNEEGKTSPMPIGIGFLNFADAANTGFGRWMYGGAPNIAELDYFAPGSYSDDTGTHLIAPTLTPTFISNDGFVYAPSVYIPYEVSLPTSQIIHVTLTYTGTNQTLTATFQTNGVDCLEIPPVVLPDDFGANDNFAVDTFSISSYSSAGDPYDSVLAHGTVGNIVVTVPPPAIQNFTAAVSNSVSRVIFTSQPVWNYTLQRTADFQAWTDIVTAPGGNGTPLSLSDTNPPTDKAFYRVKAERP
ncbi:MAG TPA: hypothetical protein VE344_09320 [Methylomirabilota bacterium]|nr:hypothetical protein [Methylomirabilota bacterium]